ncbi:LamG-like jellyroll fold domain-containing protein [Ferrimonas aestuarii]|uniref:PKD domain-containing protein n=1 Tax=Ferrimonas aestuarii TaxID=2569539 RepID=A0A4U1BSZ2_9GAMM|nr:LamG-like jellyroll fold domain-containing protein [Ferrimonas aestuarii]TKB58556.1 PKD domain-containing protein [Ferrimonas aestuarii]
MRNLLSAFLISLIGLGFSLKAAQFTSSDFTEESVARPDGQGWSGVVGITFDESGERLYAWERGGKLWVIDASVPVTSPVLDISDEVLAWRDHGLLGFALDPNFYQNGFVYLSYAVDRHHLDHCTEPTPAGPPICDGDYDPTFTEESTQATIGRITRYQAIKPAEDNDFRRAVSFDLQSRVVLVGDTPQSGFPIVHQSHSNGQLLFGNDGSLLAAFGDASSFVGYDVGSADETAFQQALDDGIFTPEENVGSYRAQLIESLNGKIIRIDPATGNGLPSNPFYQPLEPRSASSRLWSLGLRNPYRMALMPETGSHDISQGDPGVLVVGDVGNDTWEELNVVNAPGQNFGWPLFEGLTQAEGYDTRPKIHLSASAQLGCEVQFRDLIAQASLPEVTVANPCDPSLAMTFPTFGHERPQLEWQHDDPLVRSPGFDAEGRAEAVAIGEAPSVGGEPLTQGDAFVGNASTGGAWYQGDGFPEAYQGRYLHGDFGGQWLKWMDISPEGRVTEVEPFASDAGGVVFVASHPSDEALYYISWASFIYKVSYSPGGNRPPEPVASASVNYGQSPLEVSFSSAGSDDPDGSISEFDWQFGDGQSSTLANPNHVFVADTDAPQQFDVSLTLTDNGEPPLQATETLIISVNNTPPQIELTSPEIDALYPLDGDSSLVLSANLTDAEHDIGELSCKWQLILHHNNHFHEDPPIARCEAEVQLAPVGCRGQTYFYEVVLTVTDAHGLSTQRRRVIQPDCASLSPPEANDDSITVVLGTVVDVDILDNDLNIDGLGIANVTIIEPPRLGQLIVEGEALRYRPFGSEEGSDSFRYQLRNAQGFVSETALVSINLTRAGAGAALATPTISPSGGEVVVGTEVILAADADASLYYSLDGSEPTFLSTLYQGPIVVTGSDRFPLTVKVRAYRVGNLPSDVATAEFALDPQLPSLGLVGYWPMDGSSLSVLEDASGFGQDGVLVGASREAGRFGGGLGFNGINQRAVIPTNPRLQFGISDSFSLSVWVDANAAQSGWTGLVVKSRDAAPWYGLWIAPWGVWVFGGPSNVNGELFSSGWQHLALVQDALSNSRRFYLNGQLMASGGAKAADGIGDLWLGGAASVDEFFYGSLDELRIYNRALAPGEVEALASFEPTEPPDGVTFVMQADSAALSDGGTVLVDVLANDSASESINAQSLELITLPSHGSASVEEGQIRYQHQQGASQSDSVEYRVQSITGQWSPAVAVSFSISGGSAPSPNLLGYWNFEALDNGLAMDVSGNGLVANVQGAILSEGRFGQGLRFDGVDDWASVAHQPSLSFDVGDSFTLSLWVNPDAQQSGWAGVVTKSRDKAPWYGLWIASWGKWVFGGAANVVGPSVSLGWHHLVLTQDGEAGTRQLYLNGLLVKSGQAQPATGDGELWLGGSNGVEEFFAGALDEVRLFDSSVDDSEAMALYRLEPDALVVQASDDQIELETGQRLSFMPLANDQASNGWELSSFNVVVAPSYGSLEFDTSSGELSYQHDGSDSVVDGFSYQLMDVEGNLSNLAEVQVTITPPQPPTVTILSPEPDQLISGSVTLRWQLSGDASGYDHVHLQLDQQPYIPLHTLTVTEYDFGELSLGAHQLQVWLVDANHQPLGTPSSQASVSFEVQQSGSPSGLIGHWPLDGDVTDQSGNGFNAVVDGAEYVAGRFGQGLAFDGVDDKVVVGGSSAFNFVESDSFSLSLWVNVADSPSDWAGIVTVSRDAAPWYGLWLAPWRKWVFGGPSNVQGPRYGNGWQHLTLVQDAAMSQRRLYVNGVLVAVGAAQPADGGGELWFGGSAGVSEPFSGSLDEIRLYDRALSEAEIQALGQ